LIGGRDAIAHEMVAAADVADLRLDWSGHVCWRLRGGSGRVGRRYLDHIGVRILVVWGRERSTQEHPADESGAEAAAGMVEPVMEPAMGAAVESTTMESTCRDRGGERQGKGPDEHETDEVPGHRAPPRAKV
jgi:hypothetical protein